MNKTAATTIFAGLLLVGGSFVDQSIDPYIETESGYEIVATKTLEHEGESKFIASKDTPKVTFSKWNGEAMLSIAYKGILDTGSRKLFSDKIEWKEGNTEVHAYPVTIEGGTVKRIARNIPKKVLAESLPVEEGFEFAVVWNEVPETTTIQFEFDGWEDFNFYIQPPLTESEILNGNERPENIVNSIAVYHKEKRNHLLGSIDYNSGKVGHIYRMKAIDANGVEKWIDDISYDEGVLTLTVDPIWAASAAYPVVIDPTFGTLTRGASAAVVAGNAFAGSGYNSPANGTVTSISAWVSDNQADPFKGLLVLESTLVIVTNGIGPSTASLIANPPGTESTGTYSPSPSVVNADYVLGLVAQTGAGGIARFYYDTGSAGDGYVDASNSFASPTDPTDATTNSNLHSIYVTYTTATDASVAPALHSSGTLNVSGRLFIGK